MDAWDVFDSEKLEVLRAMSPDAIRAALARGELREDDLVRPAGTTHPWARLGDAPSLVAVPPPVPVPPPPPPKPARKTEEAPARGDGPRAASPIRKPPPAPPLPSAPPQRPGARPAPERPPGTVDEQSAGAAFAFSPLDPGAAETGTPDADSIGESWPSQEAGDFPPIPGSGETTEALPPVRPLAPTRRSPAAAEPADDAGAMPTESMAARPTPVGVPSRARPGDREPETISGLFGLDDDDEVAAGPVAEVRPSGPASRSAGLVGVGARGGPSGEATSRAPSPAPTDVPVLEIDEDDEEPFDPQDEDEAVAEFTLSRKGPEKVEELDLAAMVDVAFQLVLFFLVTATTVLYKTLEIPKPNPERPPAAEGAAQGMESPRTLEELKDDYIVVEIDPKGQFTVDKQPVAADFNALAERLRQARRESGRTAMLLSAQAESLHRFAVLAYDAANEIGLRIAIARPGAGSSGAASPPVAVAPAPAKGVTPKAAPAGPAAPRVAPAF